MSRLYSKCITHEPSAFAVYSATHKDLSPLRYLEYCHACQIYNISLARIPETPRQSPVGVANQGSRLLASITLIKRRLVGENPACPLPAL